MHSVQFLPLVSLLRKKLMPRLLPLPLPLLLPLNPCHLLTMFSRTDIEAHYIYLII